MHNAEKYDEVRTGDGRKVADEVEVADGFLGRALGVMFRRSLPDGYALVFEFPRERRVGLHMLFVPFPVDAVFLDDDGVVQSVESLRPWTGHASERAATVIELPGGAAEEVDKGDILVFD